MGIINNYNHRNFVNELPVGIMLVDKEFKVFQINEKFTQITSFSKEILGKKCYDFFKTEMCNTEKCPITKAKNAKKAIDVEDLRIGDQTLQIGGAPLFNGRNQIIGGMETFTDVTAQRNTIGGLPVGVMTVDNDYKVKIINQKFIDITGFTDAIIGKKCYDFFKTDMCRTNNCPIEKAKQKRKITDMVDLATGGKVIQVGGAPLFGIGNEIIGGMETFQDVTAVRSLVKNVQQIAGEVSSMSSQIAESSNQINLSVQEVTGGTQEVAKGAQHQTQSVNEISTAVVKVQTESNEIVKKSDNLAEQGAEGQRMARKGQELTDDLVLQITEITNGAEKVATTMTSLEAKSKEINKIVEVIAGIATETNLLALNAAIEAARAGDAGKGFAVVAEQVRKLAEDSKQAANQINDLIKAVQFEVGDAVTATDDTVKSIQRGEIALSGTKDQLDQLFNVIHKTNLGIKDTIQKVTSQDKDISNIVDNVEKINVVIEQSSGTAQELSSSTEEMASTLEEMSAAAEELNAAAEKLFEEVKRI
ncbi:hypothetical protein NEF87_002346 [Candidatus Lokiarchaeum ossiferum]|uniref:Methyl-accepting transducer domain-containing protein n=1 Tax=Candidatus Lokiarchaeum ossiferum TaxID=2951803 RepID=A0ABY6HRC6_9ARCH|nr:hypothetical protein NEF87_002346 [Candidatus Lokiarchaeum sp. B-35]